MKLPRKKENRYLFNNLKLNKIMEYSEQIKELAGPAFQEAVGAVGGGSGDLQKRKDILPFDPTLQSEFAGVGATKTAAELAKTRALKAAEEAEEEAESTRKGVHTQAAIERKKVGEGYYGEGQSAEAATAATGMAFSAPATRIQEEVAGGAQEKLEEIKRAESKGERVYDKAIGDIEQERDITEQTWREAELDYQKGLGGVYEEAGDLLTGVEKQLTDIMDAHRAFGESGAGRGSTGRVGAFGKQSFREKDLPEQATFESKLYQAQDFMEALESAQAGAITGAAEGIAGSSTLEE